MSGRKNRGFCEYLRTDPKWEIVWKYTLAAIFTRTPVPQTHFLCDYREQRTHTEQIEMNTGVFVHWLLNGDEASAWNYDPRIPFISSTSGASIAAAGTHPSSSSECVWIPPTHCAQQQEHTAHHNGDHDGQLAAAELHSGNTFMEVPHLHLERKKNQNETGSQSFKPFSSLQL